MSDLLDWVRHARTDTGIDFVTPADHDHWTYSDLAVAVAREVERLRDLDVSPGSVVCLAIPVGPTFIAGFYATLFIGAVPCPLPLGPTQAVTIRRAALISLLSIASPRVIYVDARTHAVVAEALDPGLEVALLQPRDRATPDPSAGQSVSLATPRGREDHLGLLQFTSGSTAEPRAVELTVANLASNIGSIRTWLQMSEDDTVVTWLPPFHDMGLVGCLLTPITGQNNIVVMQPGDFVRDPLSWLRNIAAYRATIGVAPSFALRLVLRELRRHHAGDDTDFDLAHWRTLILGAERIDWNQVIEFTRSLRPYGFKASATAPAYGLAEATLAVTGTSITEAPMAVRVDPTSMAIGGQVQIDAVANDPVGTNTQPGDVWLTSCGRPLPSTLIEIVHQGNVLPPGHLGRVRVAGPAIATRYRTGADESSPAGAATGLLTGDLGFVRDGRLYFVARASDWIASDSGQGTSPEALEALLDQPTDHAGPSRYVCLTLGDPPRVMVVAEEPSPNWLAKAVETLRAHVPAGTEVEGVAVATGWIQRTTSGKPRRASMALQLGDPSHSRV